MSISDLTFLAKDWASTNENTNQLVFVSTHWEDRLLNEVSGFLTEENAIHFERAIISALVNTKEVDDKKLGTFIWKVYQKSDNTVVIKSLEKIMHLLSELELNDSLSKAKERYHESLDKLSNS